MLTAEALPAVVDIGIRGSRETLNRVDPDDVVAHVDVAGLGAGEYTMTVHADTTADAGITSIEPKTVQVRITSAKD